MYWTPAQQLAHMTVNGATLRPGDLFASGTVSGSAEDQRGSLIELSWGGTQPLHRSDGSTRTFLEDGDTVTITATAPGPHGTSIAFGGSPGGWCQRIDLELPRTARRLWVHANGGGPRLCRTRQ